MCFGVLLLFVFLVGGNVFSKLSSNKVGGKGKAGYPLFLVVTGVTACLFFWIVAGFRLQLNGLTAVYSAIYGIVVLIVNVFQVKSYQLANVANVNVVRNACSLVVGTAMGSLLFREEVTFSVVLRVVIMLAAMLLVFADMKKTEADTVQEEGKESGILLFILVNVMLVAGICASTVVLKYYANAGDRVADDNSFFFFTNVCMIAGALVWFGVEKVKAAGESAQAVDVCCAEAPGERVQKRKLRSWLKLSALFAFVGCTVTSNVASLVELQLVDLLNVSVYTPVVSALGIISGVVTSLLFREKLGIYAMAAMGLAVIAVVI